MKRRRFTSTIGESGIKLSDNDNESQRRMNRKVVGKNSMDKRKENIDSVVARYSDLTADSASRYTLFEQFPLSSATLRGLSDANFVNPTEIQRESLVYSLTGFDIVGAAKTGSGKTLAIVVPLLECLWRQRWSRNDGLGALIISPTRELAFQTYSVLNKVGKYHDFSVALLIGGTDVEFEKTRLTNVNIIVCTPGRLLQHMDENANFSCEQLQFVTIDEADRILDLGFKDQMSAIVENLSRERQTLLFSATQTKNIDDLTRLALKDPVYISVHEKATQATPDKLVQSYFVCSDEDKINTLWSFLVNNKKKKTLIFVSCCKQARFLTEAFSHMRPGVSLMGLWGSMKQSKRLEVFQKFDRKTFGTAMIATDVASRGLDFARVDWVFQLDCPSSADDYIHRVGRTARMDAKGEAVLCLTPSQEEAMVRILRSRNIPIKKISTDARKVVDISNKLCSQMIQFPELKEFAQRSFVAYIRSIYLMRNKDVFDARLIDCTALAKSYGLVTVPRVRFLKKTSIKEIRIKQATGSVFGAKSIPCLDQMDLKNSSSYGNETEMNMNSGADDCQEDVKEHGVSDGDLIVFHSTENSDEEIDENSLLKVANKDVFHILDEEKRMITEQSVSAQKATKVISKKALVNKVLRKGLQLNAKKVFNDEEDAADLVADQKHENEETESFDIEKAKQEMAEIDKFDKMDYKLKSRKWKKEKKEKEKKLKEDKDQRTTGILLDLASDDGDKADDLSWLPDPDNPKTYDAEWNEIKGGKKKANKLKKKSMKRKSKLESPVGDTGSLQDEAVNSVTDIKRIEQEALSLLDPNIKH
ncbi:hypothetical protein AB6A40_002620 [Gnathostoma spinigerum]|uniref:ATP-dependent RNA helicase n=1 Tax=Gnathostoma spinigerum TaxID=75299 RepID=A0ABD6EES9_9BILA